MPAEYGSLTAFMPPLEEHDVDEARAPERRSAGRQGAPRTRSEPRWRSRRAAPDASPNGPTPAWDGPPAPAQTEAQAPAAPARRESGRQGAAAPSEADAWAEDPAALAVGAGAVAPGATRPRPAQDRTGPRQPVEPDVEPRRSRRAGRPQWAQSRRTVRHLDVWTVAKVSLIFYLIILLAVVVASVMLWYVADAVGAVQSIQKSARTLFSLSKFTLHPSAVAEYTSAGGAVLAVAGTFGNILAALMYNLISDLVGGIRFDVVDDAK
jgi:hypothetical protein